MTGIAATVTTTTPRITRALNQIQKDRRREPAFDFCFAIRGDSSCEGFQVHQPRPRANRRMAAAFAALASAYSASCLSRSTEVLSCLYFE